MPFYCQTVHCTIVHIIFAAGVVPHLGFLLLLLAFGLAGCQIHLSVPHLALQCLQTEGWWVVADIAHLLDRVDSLAASVGLEAAPTAESSPPSDASIPLQGSPAAASAAGANGVSGASFTSNSSWHSSPSYETQGGHSRAWTSQVAGAFCAS